MDSDQVTRYQICVRRSKTEADAIRAKYAGSDIENIPWAWGKTDQAQLNRIASGLQAMEMLLGISKDEAQEARRKALGIANT